MNFNGNNVRLVRTLRGMTQLEVAKAVHASEATIWQVERGREPEATLSDALGIVLKVNPLFFHDRIADEFTEADCFFRKGQTTVERARKRVLAQGTLFGHLIAYVQTKLTLPKYDVPELTGSTPAEIEKSANRCREHWDMKLDRPITTMNRVLENAGVMLTRLRDDESAKLDAFSRRGRNGGMSFVVLNPAKNSPSRTRFDMAHELGHLALDHQETQMPHKDREKRADRFAAAFLLPEEGVRREFRFRRGRIDWTHVFELKQRWKVSAQMILYRALDCGAIDAIEFRRAYKAMSAKGWVRDEPHEPPMETPELFRNAMTTLWQRKKLGADRVADDLHWTVPMLNDVTGLHVTAPTRDNDNVVSLAERRRVSG